LAMPVVDLGLEPIALLEERLVGRQQLADEIAKALPEGFGGDASSGQDLLVDEVVQQGSDAQRAGRDGGVSSLIHGLFEGSGGNRAVMIPPMGGGLPALAGQRSRLGHWRYAAPLRHNL